MGRAPYSVAFSPDGETLATVSGDYTLKLWDVASHREIAIFQERAGSGWRARIAFSPDGAMLASSITGDAAVKLWDIASGRSVATLEPDTAGVPEQVCDMALSGDGRFVAAGGADGTARLWDVRTKRLVTRLEGIEGQILAVAFSPDGRTLALCHKSASIKLWNVATRREVLTLGPTGALAFSPDGNTLAAARDASSLLLWRAETFAETRSTLHALPPGGRPRRRSSR